MPRYDKQAQIKAQQAHYFNERDRMIKKHYGSWLEYDHLCYLYDCGKLKNPPKSPEAYLREEDPYSGF
jgi:hypothetical protein